MAQRPRLPPLQSSKCGSVLTTVTAPAGAPSSSYSLALRFKRSNKSGTLGRLTTVNGQAGGNIEAIDNVFCFPRIFRGALACRASTINEEMKLAVAAITPSVFDRRVAETAARDVEEAAYRTGVVRRDGKTDHG